MFLFGLELELRKQNVYKRWIKCFEKEKKEKEMS